MNLLSKILNMETKCMKDMLTARYIFEQASLAETILKPYLEKILNLSSNLKVCEIGFGEGGNLKPFMDMGCRVTGIDNSLHKIENAMLFFSGHSNIRNLSLFNADIKHITYEKTGVFDLILLRDTLWIMILRFLLIWMSLRAFPKAMIWMCVLPNPAIDQFTIRSDYLITHVMVTDLSGRVVLSQPVNLYETRIDNPFDTGVFIISITTAEGVFVRKVQVK